MKSKPEEQERGDSIIISSACVPGKQKKEGEINRESKWGAYISREDTGASCN
jgi:hypothetical protein